MARLVLIADPTFKAKVGIPVAGKQPVEVEFTFKHRTRTELAAFTKAAVEEPEGRDEVDLIMDCVSGWELEDEFSRDNVARLVDNYHGAGVAISRAYVEELTQARVKN